MNKIYKIFFLALVFAGISSITVGQTITISNESNSFTKHNLVTDYGLFTLDPSVSGGINKNNLNYSIDSAWFISPTDSLLEYLNYEAEDYVKISSSKPANLSAGEMYLEVKNGGAGFGYTSPRNKMIVKVKITHNSPNVTKYVYYTININPKAAPTFANVTVSINENSANNTYALTGASSQYLGATDADGGSNGNSMLSYTLVDSSSIFTIENGTGANLGKFSVKKTGGSLNHESTSSYTLTVRAKDRDSLTTDATITINIKDVNEAPVISVAGGTTSINWNEDAGTGTVFDFNFTDPDNHTGDPNFSIVSMSGGSGSSPFQVDQETGVLTVANINHIDYESMFYPYQITVVVKVTDVPNTGTGSALSDQMTVTITIINQPESFTPSSSFPTGFAVTNNCSKLNLTFGSNLLGGSAGNTIANNCGYGTGTDVVYRIKRIERNIGSSAWTNEKNLPDEPIALDYQSGTTFNKLGFNIDDNTAFEGKEYAYRVVIKHNNGGDCNVSGFGTNYIGPSWPGRPAKPGSVNASQGSSCNQITLSWVNIANESNYDKIEIWTETKDGFNYGNLTKLTELTGTNRTNTSYIYNVPVADRGKVFRFILYAVKTSATGCATSEPAKSKDAYTIGKPLPPTGLTTEVAEGCGQIEVTWAQPDYGLIQTSVADNWQIRKRVGTDTTYHLVESVNGSYSSIIDKNPNLGQTVSYYVRGENQCGVGSYTNPSTRTLNPRVGKPTINSATTFEITSQNRNVLRFNFSPADTVQHALFRDGVEVATIPGNTTIFDYADAPVCQFSSYTIGGINGCGIGYRDTVVARIEPELVLGNINATDGTFPDKIEITWQDINYESGYRIKKGNQILIVTDENVNLYVDNNSLPGQVNTYTVEAINACKISNARSDLGFADPNGIISGHISTANGSFVEDVEVNVTPIVGTSLKFNGTPTGTGGGLDFNSNTVGSYFDLGNTAINFAGGITIEGWFYFSEFGNGTFYSFSDGTDDRLVFANNGTNSILSITSYGCAASTCDLTINSPNGFLQQNQWIHIALTIDANGLARVYKNGNLSFSSPNFILPFGSTTINRFGNNRTQSTKFKGKVDELRVWTLAKSAAEIYELYDVELETTGYPNLVRYYNFNTVGSAANKFENKIGGPVTEGTVVGTASQGQTSPVSPVIGGGYVNIGNINTANFPDNSFTLSLWLRSLNAADLKNRYLIGGAQSPGGLEFTVGKGALNVVGFKSATSARLSGTKAVNDGVWHNVIYSYDASTQEMTIYLDGKEEASGNVGTINMTNWQFVIGAQRQGKFPFKGYIDDVSMWKVPFDSAFVAKFYQKGWNGDEENIVHYWKMDEGSDGLTFDRTDRNFHGTLITGNTNPPLVEWGLTERAPAKNMGYTDSLGNYEIKAINYGKNVNGTVFTVTPSKMENGIAHQFNPQNVTRNLSFISPKFDGIDFTDISTMPISGYVKYRNTSCFIQYLEARLDGQSVNPIAQTDVQGKWLLDSPLGIHKFSINDPYVKPDSVVLYVDKPVANLPFESIETYTISGRVNGNCGVSVGPANISVYNDTKCFNKTILTNPDGSYTFDSVPPLGIVTMEVKPLNQLITFDPLYFYFDQDTIIDFTYQEDLLVTVEIDTTTFVTDNCGNTFKVLEQGDRSFANILVYEEYPGGNRCFLDSAIINIADEISSPAIFTDTSFSDNSSGIFKYSFKAGEAFLGGIGATQYKKKLEVSVSDSAGRQATANEFILVEGQRQRASTFTTTSPDIVFFVLRDPPGDASYSYLMKDSTYCSAVDVSGTVAINSENKIAAKGGVHATAGWVAEANFEGAAGPAFLIDIGGSFNYGESDEWCFTLAENVATDGGGDVVGADMDLFFGGALNYTFAKLDILEYDIDNCKVDLSTAVGRDPEGIETMFFYTQKHIKEEVIPALEFLKSVPGTPADTVTYWQDQIDGWNETMVTNTALKASATADKNVNVATYEKYNQNISGVDLGDSDNLTKVQGSGTKYSNISFGYGANYENSQAYTYSNSQTFGGEFAFAIGAGGGANFNIAGSGFIYEFEIKISTTIARQNTTSKSYSRTIGYVLGDDDPGDFFSVNIKRDNLYKTPVFETVAGESMCPHEDNTVPREGIQVTAAQNTLVNIPSNEAARFQLFITNTSQSEDDQDYNINFVDGYQDGAVVKVNGVPIVGGNGITFSVPGTLGNNTITIPVTVERAHKTYQHLGITLEASSACGDDFSDDISLNAYWQKPCTELSILNPQDGWIVDKASNDQLAVSFTDYDTSASNPLQEFVLQFQTKSGGWADIDRVNFSDLLYSDQFGETPQFTTLTWNIPQATVDGEYAVRVKGRCPATESISAPVAGIISRDAPVLFGKPEPTDGIYETGDEISIMFNENIDCSKLNVESMTLKGILSGLDYQSYGLEFDGVNDYMKIPHKPVYNFNSTTDFTVELWVKTNYNNNDPCIVANKNWNNGRNKGWAISSHQGNRWKFNIGDGADMVNVIGGIIGDNQWHHIAAAVDRDFGIFLYQDGVLIAADTSSNIFTIDDIVSNLDIGVAQDGTGNYAYNFLGKVDELRIWNTLKFQLNILQGRFRSYDFDEPNLVGCWRLDNEGSATTALDRSANQNYATLHNGPTWSLTDAAPISMDNIEQLVDISWTCAGNKIVITPNTPLKYLENSTFLATIIDAKDLNGNQIVNPISWQFYVNQNPVHWENANVAYEVGEGSVLSFTERLINDGGKLENYTLSDIPSWLSPTPVNGSIPALFTKSVEFTVDSFVNPGMYEAAITANTDNGFEKLNLEVNVLCPSPDWYVDPSIYQHSMSVTTNLVIEGDTSKDVNDKIGAFVGNEVRGVAQVQKVSGNNYLAFLTIYSDTTSGEEITFRIWDGSGCKEYPVTTPSVPFYADSVFGTVNNPLTVETTGMVAQIIELNKGWTWFSLNVNGDSAQGPMDINEVLSYLTPADGNILKSQTGTALFYEGQNLWAGSFTQMDNKKMYRIYLDEADVLYYPGKVVDPLNSPINIYPGWNHIGYPVQGNIFINTALSSLNSVLQTGDIIKSQYGYAEYVAGQGWFGSLKFLEPGIGYMLKSSGNATLYYPAQASTNARTIQNNENLKMDNNYRLALNELGWRVNPSNYTNALTITGQVYDSKENQVSGDRVIVGAFYGSECRGLAEGKFENGKWVYFLTYYSNNVETEEITFKAYFESDAKVINLQESVKPSANEVNGTFTKPFIWHLPFGDDEIAEGLEVSLDGNYLNQNKPNPVNDLTTISFGVAQDGRVTLELYNNQGQVIKTLVNKVVEKGNYTVQWDGTDASGVKVPQGVYYYAIKTNNFFDSKKIVLVRIDE